MNSGVIVIAPPWPRSGSGNLFAAQTAAHARRGARVFLLLAPLGRAYSHDKTGLWQDALSSMKFPGVETIAYPRTGRRWARSYLHWLIAGCDDSIAIAARYAAAGRLPAELTAFIEATHVDLIQANHVFSIRLARRVARLVRAVQGRRPRILLDTHDVQSKVFAARRRKNPLSHRLDVQGDLLKTELALCARADALIHVTQADCDFLANRLPDKHHQVILPTLHPDSEAELVRQRGTCPSAEIGAVYVGTRHEANLETVRWLLAEVLPLAGPAVQKRIRIVGAVGDLLSRHDPALFARHQRLLAGVVPSISDVYGGTTAVLAPATAGTGTSIKLIEALCAGKPVLTTSLALRGLPAGATAGADIQVCDTAPAFAEALTRLSEAGTSQPAVSVPNAALYDRLFSNARYFAALDDLLDGRSQREPARTGV